MPTSSTKPLSVHRAFVVQLRADSQLPRGRCVGRVEHVVSGQATEFESCEELLAFFDRVLIQLQAEPNERLT